MLQIATYDSGVNKTQLHDAVDGQDYGEHGRAPAMRFPVPVVHALPSVAQLRA